MIAYDEPPLPPDGDPSAVIHAVLPEEFAHQARVVHKRRGWLIRRMLVLADLIGLATAFAIVGLLFRTNWELVVASLGSLPMWVIIARLYRLYDQDEERTHHPTTDDLVGVFHLVTIGTWLLFIGVRAFGLARP